MSQFKEDHPSNGGNGVGRVNGVNGVNGLRCFINDEIDVGVLPSTQATGLQNGLLNPPRSFIHFLSIVIIASREVLFHLDKKQ